MAIYHIPVDNIKELTKRIKHIQNKGADITFNIGKEVVEEHELNSGAKIAVKCYEVEVEGQYKINDWSFVGTIEHSGAGNIIRSINSSLEGKIPAKYRTVGQECEHCHQIRDRKDTYLIYNEKTQEFKQVGRTCLKGYTGGLDAEKCAQFADVVNYLFRLENETDDADYFSDFVGGGGGAIELNTKLIKKTVFGYVKSYGYVPKESAQELAQILFGVGDNEKSVKDATDEEVAEMNAWVETVNTNSDYMWNAKTAWNKQYSEFRDVALLASFVKVFLKAKSDIAKRMQDNSEKNNEYVGNVGDRITIKDIKSVRILYTKEGSRYAYNAPSAYVHEIVDGQGHVYVWSSTTFFIDDFNDGKLKEIVATVKEHREYKGLKQTIVTHGKVVLNDTNKSDSTTKKNSDKLNDVYKALNSILDD